MALNRYVLTSTVTVTPGTAATVVAGEPGTGGAAGFGNAPTASGQWLPLTFIKGTTIVLDPAGSVYAAIGASNLRPFADGQDTRGAAAISNLDR
jgi:hypothetical protein